MRTGSPGIIRINEKITNDKAKRTKIPYPILLKINRAIFYANGSSLGAGEEEETLPSSSLP